MDCTNIRVLTYFNPRSPCGERPYRMEKRFADAVFQSTLPVWGATCNQNPDDDPRHGISIHAPRVGSDTSLIQVYHKTKISIHAPRVGSDYKHLSLLEEQTYFNPRSPCGERPCSGTASTMLFSPFQSTLPVWGATILSAALWSG